MYEKLAMKGPTISGKSVMCVVYNFFTSIEQFFSNEDI